MTKLGKVQYIEPRDLWPDEAKDFTPWLATSEGLELLGEAIAAELELEKTEAKVGPFSADVLCRVVGEEEHLVVIENQFGKTDHDHLGKLITYASGLKAKTVVWIADSFTDEHRQAVDWLNENKGESARFFGLEIYAIKIGDSLPAPQLKVVSSPNVWAQAVRDSKDTEISATKLDQRKFWEEVRDYFKSKKSSLALQQPRPQHWCNIAIGRSHFHLALTVNTQLERVSCQLYLHGKQAKQAFDLLITDEAYLSGVYNETQLRRELIDPFFAALGWDIDNKQGYAEAYKDVIHEDAIKISRATKAPDYCFRVGGARKFFVEAKKPSVNLKDDVSPAFQLRRYAWSAKLPLSILTDFEEFAVYDCREKPSQSDKPATGRTLYLRYTETILIFTAHKNPSEKGFIKVDEFRYFSSDEKSQQLQNVKPVNYKEWHQLVLSDSLCTYFTLNFRAVALFQKLTKEHLKFEDIIEGVIQRGISPDYAEAFIVEQEDVRRERLEKEILRPLILNILGLLYTAPEILKFLIHQSLSD